MAELILTEKDVNTLLRSTLPIGPDDLKPFVFGPMPEMENVRSKLVRLYELLNYCRPNANTSSVCTMATYPIALRNYDEAEHGDLIKISSSTMGKINNLKALGFNRIQVHYNGTAIHENPVMRLWFNPSIISPPKKP